MREEYFVFTFRCVRFFVVLNIFHIMQLTTNKRKKKKENKKKKQKKKKKQQPEYKVQYSIEGKTKLIHFMTCTHTNADPNNKRHSRKLFTN